MRLRGARGGLGVDVFSVAMGCQHGGGGWGNVSPEYWRIGAAEVQFAIADGGVVKRFKMFRVERQFKCLRQKVAGVLAKQRPGWEGLHLYPGVWRSDSWPSLAATNRNAATWGRGGALVISRAHTYLTDQPIPITSACHLSPLPTSPRTCLSATYSQHPIDTADTFLPRNPIQPTAQNRRHGSHQGGKSSTTPQAGPLLVPHQNTRRAPPLTEPTTDGNTQGYASSVVLLVTGPLHAGPEHC